MAKGKSLFASRKQDRGFSVLATSDLSYREWLKALGGPKRSSYSSDKAKWSAIWLIKSHGKSMTWEVDFDRNYAFCSSLAWVDDSEALYRAWGYGDPPHPIFAAMRTVSRRLDQSGATQHRSREGATQLARCGKCQVIEVISQTTETYKCKSCGTTNRVRNKDAGTGSATRTPQPAPQPQRSNGGTNRKMRFRDEARCQCNDCGRVWFYTKADRWKEESKSSQNSSKSMMCCTGCAPAALIPNQQVVNLDRCPDCGSRSFTKTVQQLRG